MWNNKMKVRFKKLDASARVPSKATEGSAGYDVCIPKECIVYPRRRQVIPLGLALEIPFGYEGKIEPRSGFASKGMEDINGHRMNADVIVGKVDSDYRGSIGVIVNSYENYPFTLAAGTRIAQLTIYKAEDVRFEESDELSVTSRGNGGFGHSGSKPSESNQ